MPDDLIDQVFVRFLLTTGAWNSRHVNNLAEQVFERFLLVFGVTNHFQKLRIFKSKVVRKNIYDLKSQVFNHFQLVKISPQSNKKKTLF